MTWIGAVWRALLVAGIAIGIGWTLGIIITWRIATEIATLFAGAR